MTPDDIRAMVGQYEPFREIMRAKHGYCGPYRLGIAIGEAGSALPAPPASTLR